ncbi:MAG: response regulator [Bacteroidales bacterium]|nr:response regulator [Bacteroidales bacterium]
MLTKNWEGKVILVVEDDEISLEFLKELFEPYKVTLLTVENGKDAIKICKEDKNINLVLMDVQLPVLNGKEAMKEIKKTQPELPIVAQTAFAMSGDKERYLNDGFDEYVSKPINVTELLNIIEKYFD